MNNHAQPSSPLARAKHRVAGVFEGGGAKGLAYIGALEAMFEEGVWFGKVAGASAGAITAAFVAAGCTPEEIREHTPVALKKLHTGVLRGLWRLWREGGYLPKRALLEWFDDLLIQQFARLTPSGRRATPLQGYVTFADLYRLTGIELNIVAVDLSLKRPVLFSHHDTPHCQVADAVVASSSIPFAFAPSILATRHPASSHVVVDGGVGANFPLYIFTDPTFRLTAGRPLDHGEDLVVGLLLDEETESEEPPLDSVTFERDPKSLFVPEPWERRNDRRNWRGWKEKAIAVLFFPIDALWMSAQGMWPVEPGRWPRPSSGVARRVIDALDGVAVAFGRPWIALATGVLIGISVFRGVASVFDWLNAQNMSFTQRMIRGLLFSGAGAFGAAAALAVGMTVVMLFANVLMLRVLRQVLYGLITTYLDAPGATPWTSHRDDVIALPIPRTIGILDFDLLDKRPWDFDALVAGARSVTRARLRIMLTRRLIPDIERARDLREKGEFQAAAAALRRPIDEGTAAISTIARVMLAETQAASGDVAAARESFACAIADAAGVDDPTLAASVRISYGQALAKAGDVDGSRSELSAVIASGEPETAAEASLHLGRLLHAIDPGAAQSALRQAVADGTLETSLEAGAVLALLQIFDANAAGAADTLDALIARDDKALPKEMDADVHKELRFLISKQRKATSLGAQLAVLLIAMRHGDDENSQTGFVNLYYRALASGDARMAAVAQGHAGEAFRRAGHTELAKKWLADAAKSTDPHVRAEAKLRLGALLAEGSLDSALEMLQCALASETPHASASAAIRLARLWLSQGKPDKAMLALIQRAPTSAKAGPASVS